VDDRHYLSQDFLWAAVFSTSTCSVTLQAGSSTQTFNNIGPGVSKLKIPLAPGRITVTMVKAGQTVINESPSDFTFITNPALCERLLSIGLYNTQFVLLLQTTTTHSWDLPVR